MIELIDALPKAELHLHLEGTLEPEMMMALAKRNGITLPYADTQAIREAYAFKDLQSFLNLYYQGTSVLCTEKDFYDMALAYAKRALDDHVRHVEVFFDPQTHLARGVSFKTLFEGMRQAFLDAEAEGLSHRLIMCFLRDQDEASALETLALADPYLSWIDGVGLDSAEVGHPPKKFSRVFATAKRMGLRAVAHAGEEGPPEYIWEALDFLGAERIDHGVRCLEDAELVARLRKERIPLTVCPLSNLKLCVVSSMTQHPIKKMLDKGLVVTVNSDDPAYFGGYMNANYKAISEALPLTQRDLCLMAANSFHASWLSPAQKGAFLAEIEGTAASFGIDDLPGI